MCLLTRQGNITASKSSINKAERVPPPFQSDRQSQIINDLLQRSEKKRRESNKLKPTEHQGGINCATLMQGITKRGTPRVMKTHRHAMHELTTNIPKKSTEGKRCKPPYKLFHPGITFRPQSMRESEPHPSLGNVEVPPKWPSYQQAQPP
jgi:hypothetical protein